MPTEHDLHVKVSGNAVYAAVKNYLKDSPHLHESIDRVVDKALTPEFVHKQVINRLTGNDYWNSSFKAEVRAAINAAIQTLVKEQLTDAIVKKLLGEVKLVIGGPK